ncbi:MAG: hypothetical protein QOG65_2554 [Actinomycetota bacterium]|nr:hypothetical protein [Actinomycetota bacterium]
MSTCPGCNTEVRPLWPTCRGCGTLLMAPPAPMTSEVAAAAGATSSVTNGVSSVHEQFFAPAVLQPVLQLPQLSTAPTRRSGAGRSNVGGDAGKWIVLAAMFFFFVAAIATAWLTFKPGSTAQTQTPVVLPPRPASEGLPSGLDTVVRIQAESTRRTALQTAEQIGGGDIAQLAAAQPGYQWVMGDASSTDAHTVSVAPRGGAVTIAVAASNHDICAFGQWSTGTTPRYVTMGRESSCRAVDAPVQGWSSEPGGAASDLPDAIG